MALVRLRVACRGRVEIHEVDGPDIEIGRDHDCALSVDHPSVASRHAVILIRRNRMILSAPSHTAGGTTRGGDRVLAPVALADGETFTLGDVSFAGWIVHPRDRGIAGRALAIGCVANELESPDHHVRRYEISGGSEAGELAVASRDVPSAAAQRWIARMRESGRASPHLATLLGSDPIDDQEAIFERVHEGIRLASLIDGVQGGLVTVPVEAMIVVFAHLADAVAAIGRVIDAHGAIDPRSVQLGIDGSISLLRPAPLIDGRSLADELVAPERRISFEATPAGDAFALGKIGARVLALSDGAPPRIRAICAWLAHAEPRRRPTDLAELAAELRAAAMRDGLDPTYNHVARAVRVLAPAHARPLARLTLRSE
jgi:hypothetical protein